MDRGRYFFPYVESVATYLVQYPHSMSLFTSLLNMRVFERTNIFPYTDSDKTNMLCFLFVDLSQQGGVNYLIII